jgi:hypothetical protein
MDALRIECLGCGEARMHAPAPDARRLDPGECPRCGYVGWAPSAALTEPVRRRIRERPVNRRSTLYAI